MNYFVGDNNSSFFKPSLLKCNISCNGGLVYKKSARKSLGL